MGMYKDIGHPRSQCNSYYVSISSIFAPFKYLDYSISEVMGFLFYLHI
jgi:hypothetical protein